MKIHNCEQNTAEWLKLRCAIPTSSGASKLVTSKGEPSKSMKDYAAMLAGEKYAMLKYNDGQIDDFDGNKYTERGHELESEALEYYSMMNDVDLVQVGFVTNDDETEGSSPDALCGEKGLVEVKCLGYKAHIEAVLYIDKNKKMPTKYVAQTQDQMVVCEREWNDIIFYHPKLPPMIFRALPNKEVIEGLKLQKKALIIERERVFKILNKY